MPIHPAAIDEEALLADCEATTTRRSGPGGQHRNKVETAVVVTHNPTGIAAEANERRSQDANRRVAVRRLRLRLALEHRMPVSEVSQRWHSRVEGQRIAVSVDHRDYPALLAEALDQLAACDFDTSKAADRLGVSGTQFVNLLRKHPPALTKLNDERRARGLRPLK